jgi:DNA-directed RNA polymerase III subunit RPC6
LYNVIHSSGRSGVWVRNIQSRTNLHKSILDRCVKSLESKNYIKSVHNVKYPTRKMYMLAGLAPSEDITGGAWFTDGVLDANFINSVAGFIEYTVSIRSWHEVPAADLGRGKRIKTATGMAEVKAEPGKTYLPYPANYTGYLTVEGITSEINRSGITPVRLGEDSVMQLVQMLCFDKKIVALNNGNNYKALRNPDMVKASQARKPAAEEETTSTIFGVGKNGMTESPCGSCPNIRLCSPGAAISPETCEYFDPWYEKVLGF